MDEPQISLRMPFVRRFIKSADAGKVEVTLGDKKLTAKEVKELCREMGYLMASSERFRRAQHGWKKKWDKQDAEGT